MRFILVSLVLCSLASVTSAQAKTGYSWLKSHEGPNWFMLRKDAETIGYFDKTTNKYRPLVGKDQQGNCVWGQEAEPPITLDTPVENYGIDETKFSGGGGITYQGSKISKEQAIEMLSKGHSGSFGDPSRIPDETKKKRLLVIDQSEASRKRILAEADELKGSFVPWSVPPDHFSLKDNVTGEPIYPTDTTPSVIIQEPDGTVHSRNSTDPQPGEVIGALRRANKEYDPKKDPPLSPTMPVLGGIDEQTLLLIGGGILILVIGFSMTKQQEQ